MFFALFIYPKCNQAIQVPPIRNPLEERMWESKICFGLIRPSGFADTFLILTNSYYNSHKFDFCC